MSLINKEKSLYVMGLILAILLILSGCGKDRKEINVKADTGETVQATLWRAHGVSEEKSDAAGCFY